MRNILVGRGIFENPRINIIIQEYITKFEIVH